MNCEGCKWFTAAHTELQRKAGMGWCNHPVWQGEVKGMLVKLEGECKLKGRKAGSFQQ
jgi:hypothetical protein